MSSNSIPTWSREVVAERDGGRCVMCRAPGTNCHHRRSRSVHDEHRHCPCVLVTMCGSGTTGCHGYVHARPLAARGAGLIVTKFAATPGLVPFRSGLTWVFPDCKGGAVRVTAADMDEAVEMFTNSTEQGE